MADIELGQLFHKRRCLNIVSLLVCLLYAPVGVALATVRFCVCLQAVCALYLLQNVTVLRTLVLRVMSAVMGIWVRVDERYPPCSDSSSHGELLLSNSVSWFDWLAIQMVKPCVTVCGAGVPALLQSTLKLCHLTYAAAVFSVRQRGQSVLLQPEGTPTNGSVALLRFSSKLLPAGVAVNPVAVSVCRPWLFALAVTTLDSSPISDLLYFFFVPYTVFTLRFLPVVYDEAPSVLVEKARSSIATSLGVALTEYSLPDKTALLKRESARSTIDTASDHQSRAHTELSQMALRVKQVLPHVPLTAIRSDIVNTHCIDRTIANFLDGAVQFLPEQPSSCASSCAVPAAPLFTGAAVFSRDSSQRHLSFQQRKQQLLTEARRRYIDKHGLHHLLNQS